MKQATEISYQILEIKIEGEHRTIIVKSKIISPYPQKKIVSFTSRKDIFFLNVHNKIKRILCSKVH